MSRKSQDPFGDFVVRVMNACHRARGQSDTMSDDEFFAIEAVRERLLSLGPSAEFLRRTQVALKDR